LPPITIANTQNERRSGSDVNQIVLFNINPCGGGVCLLFALLHRPDNSMKFYVGLHKAYQAVHFDRALISINSVRNRRKPIVNDDWILDSGAFSEIAIYGRYRYEPSVYAAEINRLASFNRGLRVAVSQDYMCEPTMLERTGLNIIGHQTLTIERYDALLPLVGVYLMPVLQGYDRKDYLSHIEQYGARLRPGMLVGVGSICKRNSSVAEIETILLAINHRRPDLHLHGFGLKISALRSGLVRDKLYSADSMAWSYAARRQGRNQNSWQEAMRFVKAIDRQAVQLKWEF
jgi:hypothetical protein